MEENVIIILGVKPLLAQSGAFFAREIPMHHTDASSCAGGVHLEIEAQWPS
jgi:hypothetical protein